MGKFRVGDVCEIVDCAGFINSELRKFIGCECTVLAIGLTDSPNPECTIRCEVPGFRSDFGSTARFRPQELRLRRPPAWDRWINSDSHLDKERETDDVTDDRIRRGMRDLV